MRVPLLNIFPLLVEPGPCPLCNSPMSQSICLFTLTFHPSSIYLPNPITQLAFCTTCNVISIRPFVPGHPWPHDHLRELP